MNGPDDAVFETNTLVEINNLAAMAWQFVFMARVFAKQAGDLELLDKYLAMDALTSRLDRIIELTGGFGGDYEDQDTATKSPG